MMGTGKAAAVSTELDSETSAISSSVVILSTGGAGTMAAAGSASMTPAGGSELSLRRVLVKLPQPASNRPTATQTMADGERRTSDPPRAHGLIPRTSTEYSRSESPRGEKSSAASRQHCIGGPDAVTWECKTQSMTVEERA